MCAEGTEKDENASISDDEHILRRIVNNEDYYNPSLEIAVTPVAFRATSKDTTGISIYRSLFVTPKDVADAGPSKKGYYVAQIYVAEIIKEGMTAIPKPLPEADPAYLPSHSEIPEINYVDYKSDKEKKERIKELQLQLAILASKDIVHTP